MGANVINMYSKLFWIAVSCFLSAGCANPINAKTASIYYQQGIAAENNGDLLAARQAYSRAYKNAQLGNLSDKDAAYALYEWSRVSGYLKIYDDAEGGFRKTLILIAKASPSADQLKPPALSELARMLNNTNKHEKAVPIFKQAVYALENAQFLERDPIGYAHFLDMYAQSLKKTGDTEHLHVLQQIEDIRLQHPNAKAKSLHRQY